MAYIVRLKPRAERDLDRLRIGVARRIWQKLVALEGEPRLTGASKLKGSDGYRIRIVYLIDDSAQVVEVVRVAHRRKVYR